MKRLTFLLVFCCFLLTINSIGQQTNPTNKTDKPTETKPQVGKAENKGGIGTDGGGDPYINNQFASPQAAAFWIDGTGRTEASISKEFTAMGPFDVYGNMYVDGNGWSVNFNGGSSIARFNNTGIGIGTVPAAQFHTTGSVRFEGIGNNNSLSRVIVADGSGNLAWRDASTLGGGGGSSQWTTNGSDIYYNTGNVGIGTANPTAKLNVVGDGVFNGFVKAEKVFTTTPPAGSGLVNSVMTLNGPGISVSGVSGVNGTLALLNPNTYSFQNATAGVVGSLLMNNGANYNYTYMHELSAILAKIVMNGSGNAAGATADRLNAIRVSPDVYYNSNIGWLTGLKIDPPYLYGGGTVTTLNSIYVTPGAGDAYFGDKVNIGANSIPTGYKLAVGGNIIAEKVRVKLQSTGWPDYVFHPMYDIPTLKEVEQFIKENNHLPGVPSADEVGKNGLDLGDSQAILLKKIEELTLYMIDMNKRFEKLEMENQALRKKLEKN